MVVHLFIPEILSHRSCALFVKTGVPYKDRFIIEVRKLYIKSYLENYVITVNRT